MPLARGLPPPWIRADALTGDASVRRYLRVRDAGGGSAILVIYPACSRPQLVRDLEVRRWYQGLHLRVPQLIDGNIDEGWVVLEDFGTQDASAVVATVPPRRRVEFVARALQPLATLAEVRVHELPTWNAPLDADRLRWELAGFELWYVRVRRGRRPSLELGHWLDNLARRVSRHPRRVCHRDYHLNNLYLLDGRTVGIIDFQDTLIGPDCYDAVSLVGERDAHRMLADDERRQVIARWAAATGAAPGWQERCLEAGLQRALKVLGTFARLEAGGRTEYRRWLAELETATVARLRELGSPAQLTDILLDL